MAATTSQKQVNLRLDDPLYRTLETLARQERRSVPQTARMLLQERLRQRTGHGVPDDLSSLEVAEMAQRGGAFDWLADEPDLYDDACGEPI